MAKDCTWAEAIKIVAAELERKDRNPEFDRQFDELWRKAFAKAKEQSDGKADSV